MVLYGNNDSDEEWSGEVRVRRMDFLGRDLGSWSVQLRAAARENARLGVLPISVGQPGDRTAEFAVAEVGDVKLVVKQPHHPYTQLLVGSIPLPDPAHTWRAEEVQAGIPGAGNPRACRFTERCPNAMPMCVETPPPLFRSGQHRAASCYLYRDAPVLDPRDMDHVFVPPRVPV